MAENPAASPTAPPADRGKKTPLSKRKIAGLPAPVAIAAAAAVAVLGFLYWRDKRRGAGGGAATSGTSTSTADQSTEAAELAELQSELNQLTGQSGGGGGGIIGVGGSTGTGTGTGGGTTASTGTGTVPVTSSTGTSTSTGTGTATKLADNPVKNLRLTDTGYTSVIGEWNKMPNATTYQVQILQGGKVIKTQHAVGDTARVGNLKRGTAYTYRVRAQPGKTGARDANVNFTTKK
jgi:hypothetical protein